MYVKFVLFHCQNEDCSSTAKSRHPASLLWCLILHKHQWNSDGWRLWQCHSASLCSCPSPLWASEPPADIKEKQGNGLSSTLRGGLWKQNATDTDMMTSWAGTALLLPAGGRTWTWRCLFSYPRVSSTQALASSKAALPVVEMPPGPSDLGSWVSRS
jgi:hypothetical protein